jgi:hypothetical protein
LEPETISYFYAPPVQNLLKTYKPEEESRLNTFLDKFAKTDCDYNEGCRSDTCRFCGTPDKWVNLIGFGNLCDLVLSYIGNDRQIKKAK